MSYYKKQKLKKKYRKTTKALVVASLTTMALGAETIINNDKIHANEVVQVSSADNVNNSNEQVKDNSVNNSNEQIKDDSVNSDETTQDDSQNISADRNSITNSNNQQIQEKSGADLTIQEALMDKETFASYIASINIGDNKYTVGHAVDIASYQSWMTQQDFQKLKDLGIQTVVVKVTQGTHYVNPYAATQIKYAQEAGLTVAVYHYAEFTDYNTGRAEADYLANQLKNLKLTSGVLIFADMEKSPGNANYPTPTVNGLNAFWQRLNECGYYKHGVYLSPSFPNFDQVVTTVGKAWTWIAQYPNDPVKGGEYEQKWRNEGYGAWQFSSNAHIPGNGNNLDLSHDYNGLLTDKAKEGWQSDGNNGFVYYENGKRVTGEKKINGYWYYFDSNGRMDTGFINLGNRTVYYNAQGQMQYGEQNIAGKWYYFDKGNGAMAKGFTKLSNRTVYYNAQGQMQYGEQNINGKWYYFDKGNGAMATGLTKLSNKTVYYNENGQMQYGEQQVKNDYYFFDTGSGALSTGLQTVGNTKKYYGSDGKRQTGEKQLDGYWYYFDPSKEGSMSIGFVKLNNRTVYYNAQGHMQYGKQNINGKWYYFDTGNGAMSTGLFSVGNDKYYANDKGEIQFGEVKVGSNWYYFDSKTGIMQTGTRVNLETRVIVYYQQDGKRASGTITVGKDSCTFDPGTGALTEINGKPVEGPVIFDGKEYLFDKNCSVVVGWQNVNGGKDLIYYDEETGNKVYGEKKIQGYWYYFVPNTGLMATSFIDLPNRKVYYNDKGQMQYGEQNIGGYWYYFDLGNGAMKTGFVDLPNKRVFYNEKGQMQYGEQKINGYWYYFDKGSGAMQTGFVDLSNKRVYYNGQGQMQYGWQTIGNHDYYFDTWTGSMARGTININGRNYTFSSDGVYQGFTERVANWFYSRIGKITYSMYGSRNGKDGTADCSGSITQALWDAGASRPADNVIKWGGYNTETIHPYLKANGYYLVAQGTADFTPQRGDIIIWGKLGSSGGAGGHIMLVTTSGPNPNVISTCGYDMSKGQAIKEFGYNWYWNYDGRPYYYVYRPVDPHRA